MLNQDILGMVRTVFIVYCDDIGVSMCVIHRLYMWVYCDTQSVYVCVL